jgi:hypothetical protein
VDWQLLSVVNDRIVIDDIVSRRFLKFYLTAIFFRFGRESLFEQVLIGTFIVQDAQEAT